MEGKWAIAVHALDDALCFATILNKFYVITPDDCLKNISVNEINLMHLFRGETIYRVKAIENAGKFKLIKTTRSLPLDDGYGPICLNNGKVSVSNVTRVLNYEGLPGHTCVRSIHQNESSVVAECLNLPFRKCHYTFGVAFHVESVNEIEGEKRWFMSGIGKRDQRLSETDPDTDFYKCDISGDSFGMQEYQDLDFYDIEAPHSKEAQGEYNIKYSLDG